MASRKETVNQDNFNMARGTSTAYSTAPAANYLRLITTPMDSSHNNRRRWMGEGNCRRGALRWTVLDTTIWIKSPLLYR